MVSTFNSGFIFTLTNANVNAKIKKQLQEHRNIQQNRGKIHTINNKSMIQINFNNLTKIIQEQVLSQHTYYNIKISWN